MAINTTREENFHLSKTKIVPIMATDDEHKLSHISTIYYEDFFFYGKKRNLRMMPVLSVTTVDYADPKLDILMQKKSL